MDAAATTIAAGIMMDPEIEEMMAENTEKNGNRNNCDRDTRGRHGDCRQNDRQEVSSTKSRGDESSLGSHQVRFDQVRDSLSGRRTRRSRSSSARSRNSSLSSRSSSRRSRSSSVNSRSVEMLHSESSKSRGYVFAVDADSNARKNKHPVTVALTRDVNGRPSVLRTLIDACCTGRGADLRKDSQEPGS